MASGNANQAARMMVALLAVCAPLVPLSWGQAQPPAEKDKLAAALDPRRICQDVKLDVKVIKPKAEFASLEPIRLFVEAQNVSKDRPLFPRTEGNAPESDHRMFVIRVFDSNGEPVPRTVYSEYDVKYLNHQIGGSIGGSFNPGERWRSELVANLVCDMTSPDKYTVLVEMPVSEKKEIDGAMVKLVGQSQPVKVQVLPDPRRPWPFLPRMTRAGIDEATRKVDQHFKQQEQERARRETVEPRR